MTCSDAENLANTHTGIAAASGARKVKLTANEHLANAMLLNEEQSRKLKVSRAASMGNKLVTAITALTMNTARTATAHWAITLVTLQCIMPRLNPRLRGVALHCLAMLKSALFSLGAQLATQDSLTCSRLHRTCGTQSHTGTSHVVGSHNHRRNSIRRRRSGDN